MSVRLVFASMFLLTVLSGCQFLKQDQAETYAQVNFTNNFSESNISGPLNLSEAVEREPEPNLTAERKPQDRPVADPDSPAREIDEDQSRRILDYVKRQIVLVEHRYSWKKGRYIHSVTEAGSGVIREVENGVMRVLTNRHLIDCKYGNESCQNPYDLEISIRTQSGKKLLVDRIGFVGKDVDFAELEVKISSSEAKEFENLSNNYFTTSYAAGDEVIAVSCPECRENSTNLRTDQGSIVGILRKNVGDNQTIKTILSDVVVIEGSSGGALFNRNGDLIGIITWKTDSYLGSIAYDSLIGLDRLYCSLGRYPNERNACSYY